uniref:DUF4605 domain-containing protein n=1 Tax=Romanomermis culicivorax TaxID=13658 RepID=A0A915KK31_ROMCU
MRRAFQYQTPKNFRCVAPEVYLRIFVVSPKFMKHRWLQADFLAAYFDRVGKLCTTKDRMVRILANGDIVQDDDPRAQRPSAASSARPHYNASSESSARAGQSHFYQQSAINDTNFQRQSGLDVLNSKLLNFGIPRWSLGGVTIEPVYTIGALLMFMLFGFLPSLCLIGILFVVSQLSRDNGANLRSIFHTFKRSLGGGGGSALDGHRTHRRR